MLNRISFLAVCAIFSAAQATAQENNPLWLRNNSISPDGTEICFTYKGDIYTVPSEGGNAKQITTNSAFDSYPVWSPDGKTIAFASDREGKLDIYTVPSHGGVPKRLTFNSADEIPVAFLDDSTIIFKSCIMPSEECIQFPSSTFPQTYTISTSGGRPAMFASIPMENISVSPDGNRILYHDVKGYEDNWRKHHASSVTRDVWMCSIENGKPSGFAKMTDFAGEDRNPAWAEDGNFFYLSEKDGTSNVWKMNAETGKSEQITFHKGNPVRFLSTSKDGKLCYGYNGEIYTAAFSNGKWNEEKTEILITRDNTERNAIDMAFTSGASEFAVSPDEKEIAVIVRGDIFVASVEYGTTRQITSTPGQERSVSFSPDGRSLVYASERDGLWQIYESSIVRDEDKSFCYATEIEEKRITNTCKTSFQPAYSPDGKDVAFLEERTGISAVNLKSGKQRTIMDKKYEYSYADGDQWFQWSPDSKWILTNYIGVGGWNNKDIALVKADGSGEIHNLTESGYNDVSARWALDGKAMIWLSDRAGYRSHGSWGAYLDIYMMFFDRLAYEKFLMSEEELALYEAKEKSDDGKKKEKEKAEPLSFDLENSQDRIARLTVNSSGIIDAYLSKKADKLYYLTTFEGTYDLWCHDLKKNTTSLFLKNVGAGALKTGNSESCLFVGSPLQIKKIDLATSNVTPVGFKAEFRLEPEKERKYVFDHVWRQVKDKFYVEDLHGADWDGYRENYKRFIPHINNDRDFADMLGELLGELNGSHTGARYLGQHPVKATAYLGMFFDQDHDGDGLKIAEIIRRSPAAIAAPEIKPGFIIESIDGKPVKKGEDYYSLLAGKAGKQVHLSVCDPAKKKSFESEIKAISWNELYDLLYKRWIDNCEKTVDSLSGGQVGYIHIKAMDSDSFRDLYSRLLGKNRHKKAVIIDTRHNGGGWLHDDVATLLDGEKYREFIAHGQYIGDDPFNKWTKPSCMLVCEDNYSNAHGTPWVYQHLGIGKLVGSPVPGTMTAVWWEVTVNPAILFGIPQVGWVDMDGKYAENTLLEPDILVYNTPEDMLEGRDSQLEKAVELMMETISAED